jgi:diaminopimelate epimerase
MTAGIGGRRFWKMSGSGNDFVFFDVRESSSSGLDTPEAIGRLCSRTQGVGADGVVFVERHPTEAFAIRYYNRDGSRGELCGNASLCSTQLGVRLGLGPTAGFAFSTDVGPIAARMVDGLPEIDLQPSHSARLDAGIPLIAGERRIGFVDTGVPHLVVLADDAEAVRLMERGSELRHHASLAAGANVNFVSPAGAAWRMRTFERGVEGETLACGTGSAATAFLLVSWGLAAGPEIRIQTTSGRILTVTLRTSAPGQTRPSLRGEGRLVFEGTTVDL